jgi:anti-anti-sigma regulatory factor
MPTTFSWSASTETHACIALRGDITESAKFADVLAAADQVDSLDLSGITRINSTGVRQWLHFVRALDDRGKSLRLVRCSPAFVAQLNMIAGFTGRSVVKSVLAPLLCLHCDVPQEQEIFTDGDLDAQLAAVILCPTCRSQMELDDIADNFFAFVRLRAAREA